MESLDASVLFVLEQSDGGAMLAAAVERLRASGVERVTFEVVGLCPEVYDVVVSASGSPGPPSSWSRHVPFGPRTTISRRPPTRSTS